MAASPSRFGTVSVSETRHSPRSVLPPHEHVAAYLSFVVHGDYAEIVGSQTVQCSTHRVRFHPAGEVHANKFGNAGGICLNIELDDQWSERLKECGLTDPNDLVLDDGTAWLALRIRNEFRVRDRAAALSIEELTALIIDSCGQSRRQSFAIRDHRPVQRAIEFIHAHIAVPFALGDVAQAAHLHRTHFARAFRKHMGCTVGEYTRRVRLTRVQDTMRQDSNRSFSRLAADAGFADHAHFTRTFSRVVGATPSAFRRAVMDHSTELQATTR